MPNYWLIINFDHRFWFVLCIQVVRELDGVDIIGADLVEVSPPFDPNGGTAWLGVSIMFELLCVMAKNIDDKN